MHSLRYKFIFYFLKTLTTLNFEIFLNEIDMVSDYSIQKFDKEFIFYEVLFNGTVQNFINIMKNKKYNLNTQKKVWIIEWET